MLKRLSFKSAFIEFNQLNERINIMSKCLHSLWNQEKFYANNPLNHFSTG